MSLAEHSAMNTEILKIAKSRGVMSRLKQCTSRLRAAGGGSEGRGGNSGGDNGRGGVCGWGDGRNAERLLPHLSLVLAWFVGAGLATCARLRWDPSAYVALREVFPQEYRAVCVALPAACAAAALLNHLALVALRTERPQRKRLLLFVYAALTALLVACEAGFACWLGARLAAWTRSPEAHRVMAALDFKDHFVAPALAFLGRFVSISRKAKEVMDEADTDVPVNLYVAVGAGAALALLQLLAAALALLAAPPAAAVSAATPPPFCDCSRLQRFYNGGSGYKNRSTYIDMMAVSGARRHPPPPPLAPVA